jgi:hypothetical protein
VRRVLEREGVTEIVSVDVMTGALEAVAVAIPIPVAVMACRSSVAAEAEAEAILILAMGMIPQLTVRVTQRTKLLTAYRFRKGSNN